MVKVSSFRGSLCLLNDVRVEGIIARTSVTVTARRGGSHVTIDIDDDGAGLDPAAMPEAMRPGRRIDEATPDYGFGLPIAAELAELYGGSLELSKANNGGVETGNGSRARVILPQAR